MEATKSAKPFVKWAGGKRKLLDELTKRVPKKYNTYYEPFVGGGALYWHLKPEKAVLSDVNKELINTYNAIKYNKPSLIRECNKHQDGKEYFLKTRELDRQETYDKMDCLSKASRFIFINKRCFNGLYKVNKKGQINSAYGKRDGVALYDNDNLKSCHRILQKTEVCCAPYQWILSTVQRGDFVYLDPPYLNITSSSIYVKEIANLDFHKDLQRFCDELTERGVYWLMSNSSDSEIVSLWDKYIVNTKKVYYSVSGISRGRKDVKEIIVTNYNDDGSIVCSGK